MFSGTGQRGRGGSNTRGNWRGRGNFKSFRGGRGRGRGGAQADKVVLQTQDGGTSEQAKIDEEAHLHALDEKLGFLRFQEGQSARAATDIAHTQGAGSPRVGWLVNMKAVSLADPPKENDTDCLSADGSSRRTVPSGSVCRRLLLHSRGWRPLQVHPALRALLLSRLQSTWQYLRSLFQIAEYQVQKGYESQVEEYLLKRYEGTILRLERKRKEDLKLVSPI